SVNHKSAREPEPKPATAPAPAEAGAPPTEAADSITSTSSGQANSPQEVLKDRLLRLQADFDNYRKRVARERAEEQQQAAEQLILALLPALDHFELGLRNAQTHGGDATLVDGFRLIYQQLGESLKQAGLTPLAVESQLFNPHEHEAITSVPSEEYPADMVITEVRRGYRLGAKLLRPAQVIVSSGPLPAAEPGPRAGAPPPKSKVPAALPEESAD
ncbi:MAG: nucleotide exchange factor GrpE, partial [Kiritimatiellaeota bacterium]|nr:nucleotide exchange factor GrpE [Kiritimatiellota bacterium]